MIQLRWSLPLLLILTTTACTTYHEFRAPYTKVRSLIAAQPGKSDTIFAGSRAGLFGEYRYLDLRTADMEWRGEEVAPGRRYIATISHPKQKGLQVVETEITVQRLAAKKTRVSIRTMERDMFGLTRNYEYEEERLVAIAKLLKLPPPGWRPPPPAPKGEDEGEGENQE